MPVCASSIHRHYYSGHRRYSPHLPRWLNPICQLLCQAISPALLNRHYRGTATAHAVPWFMITFVPPIFATAVHTENNPCTPAHAGRKKKTNYPQESRTQAPTNQNSAPPKKKHPAAAWRSDESHPIALTPRGPEAPKTEPGKYNKPPRRQGPPFI